ncbi:unnamed protein product [Thelazia callipaeda]|uniref:Kunitz/Bovine pancreatic trypsin inhibitor domain protein n=1 Tax=Thelazia callipaeda TaxID=103827 RepID=A0A0N5CSA6_THECL|nr:unnamed protein product [Thelazia callipaeda]
METSFGQVALVVLCCVTVVASQSVESVDPCKRQPFRGRCPSIKGKIPTRSQFVLRYYERNSECVSYPFGHCADDENEPMLYRYKHDCEKACLDKAKHTELSSAEFSSDYDISSTSSTTVTSNTDDNIGKFVSSTWKPLSDDDAQLSSSSQESTPASQATRSRTAYNAVSLNLLRDTEFKGIAECEKRREAIESGLLKSDFVPICTNHGSFLPLQCGPEGEYCFCVDHNGIEIPNSRSISSAKPNCSEIMKAQKPAGYECISPVDSGPCTASLTRWYYDEKREYCVKFQYSGK